MMGPVCARHSVEEMARIIGVDSLAFLSIDGLYRATGRPAREGEKRRFCDACFTGAYPTKLADQDDGEVSNQMSFLLEEQGT